MADGADVTVLADQLAPRITGEVRFNTGARAAYATDASICRQIPISVRIPRTLEDIVETRDVCREQIAQLTERDALHIAEMVALAINRAHNTASAG